MKLIISLTSIALIVSVYFNVLNYWCATPRGEPAIIVAQEHELTECIVNGKVFNIVERY